MNPDEEHALQAFHDEAERVMYDHTGLVPMVFMLYTFVTHIAEWVVIIFDASARFECYRIVWIALLIDVLLGQLASGGIVHYLQQHHFSLMLIWQEGVLLGLLLARFVLAILIVTFELNATPECRDEWQSTHRSLYHVAMMALFGYIAAPFVWLLGYRHLIWAAWTALQRRYHDVMVRHRVVVEEYRDHRDHVCRRHRIRRGEQGERVAVVVEVAQHEGQ